MSPEIFRCALCGREYEQFIDRAKCEIRCDNTAKAKIEQERQMKLKAEEDKRLKTIQDTYCLLTKQIADFKNDYHKPIWIQDNSIDLVV